jgi:hypothetical protein
MALARTGFENVAGDCQTLEGFSCRPVFLVHPQKLELSTRSQLVALT